MCINTCYMYSRWLNDSIFGKNSLARSGWNNTCQIICDQTFYWNSELYLRLGHCKKKCLDRPKSLETGVWFFLVIDLSKNASDIFLKSVIALILVRVFLFIQAKNEELLWKIMEINIYKEDLAVMEITWNLLLI